MADYSPADKLHRLVKEALDSGAASTIAEAEYMFRALSLELVIGEKEARDPNHQAALLTALALAVRVFLGGVWVSGPLDVALTCPLPLGETLESAVAFLGGKIGDPDRSIPRISIGGGRQKRAHIFHVRTAFSGWRAGIVPADADEFADPENAVMPLSPMLAAALAVNEAFSSSRFGRPAFGRKPVGFSLWNPASLLDWRVSAADEPKLAYLPNSIWLIGLGHLGQAYLWGLGLLPYQHASKLSLVLQDVDIATPSTVSTSILTDDSQIGWKKTRSMAAWAERRGFNASIIERLFTSDFRRQLTEPAIAMCGLDNALGRQALDQVGFEFIVEAGLGRGYQDFRTMRLYTLPAPRSAAEIWREPGASEDLSDRPGYAKMLEDGDLDRCGITLLSGKAVGAPFVGAIAACLAISEILRLLHGGPLHQLIDLSLQSIEHRSVIAHSHDFNKLNPGYVLA